jgi:hypothetical protein
MDLTVARVRGADEVWAAASFGRDIAGPALEQFRAGLAKIEEAREASGCEALYREVKAIDKQAFELHDPIRDPGHLFCRRSRPNRAVPPL